MITVKIASAITSPVSAADLQSWLELPDTDPKLSAMCEAATDAVTTYLRRAILPTDIVLHVSGMSYFIHRVERYDGYPYIELPYADLLMLDSVTIDGEALVLDESYKVDAAHTPARLHVFGRCMRDILTVEYSAGMFATANDVPQAIRVAVLMVAAYMFEHRGMCEAKEAIQNSGALTYLRRYIVEQI